jgi:HK97 gp10 family phage protein
VRVTVTGAEELADAWDAAAERADDELRPVVSKGALNIKKATQAKWAGHRHAPTLAASVTYDLDDEGGNLGAEIGPDKEKTGGGPLGTIYEYGVENGTQSTAPQPALNPSLDEEAPRFERNAGDVAEKLADV